MLQNKRANWSDFLEFPLKGRNYKPRETGVTMVIDKGLGLIEIEEMLKLSSEYIDFIKLGFGTSALYSSSLLEKKIELVKSCSVDIFPGGTLLEVAVLQKKLQEYLKICKKIGYSAIEISDGTIDMDRNLRADALKMAADMGFTVLSEVGKKDSNEEIDIAFLHEQIEEDLINGAFKVIVEGRESGKGVVIYDDKGKIKEDKLAVLDQLITNIDSIIWEAPLKKQQQDLILRFGSNVNLGNIQPEEILALEALRVGLRGDTLRTCLR